MHLGLPRHLEPETSKGHGMGSPSCEHVSGLHKLSGHFSYTSPMGHRGSVTLRVIYNNKMK